VGIYGDGTWEKLSKVENRDRWGEFCMVDDFVYILGVSNLNPT